jgi:hypothetical protein
VKVGQECIESVQRLQGPQLFLVEMAMATVGSTSLIGGNVGSCGVDQLPKEMHDMKIRDEKVDHSDDKEVEAAVVDGNGTETGHIISTTIGGRNGQPKQVCAFWYLHTNLLIL